MKNKKNHRKILVAGLAVAFVCSLTAGTGVILNNRMNSSVISTYASGNTIDMGGSYAFATYSGGQNSLTDNNISKFLAGLPTDKHVDIYILDTYTTDLTLELSSSADWTLYIVDHEDSILGGTFGGTIVIPAGATLTLGSGTYYKAITNNGVLKLSSLVIFDTGHSITASTPIDANGYTGDITIHVASITAGAIIMTNYTSNINVTVSDNNGNVMPDNYKLFNESGNCTIRKKVTITFKDGMNTSTTYGKENGYIGLNYPTISFTAPTKSNYTFLGFYTEKTSGVQYYNENLEYVTGTVAAATTLYAHWEEETTEYAAPTAKTNLKYNGEAQELINAGSCDSGTVEYSLDESSWSTNLPTGTNVDNYVVYYRITKNSSTVASGNINVSIAKGDPVLNSAPTAKSLTYTGSNQDLINAGSCIGGVIYYSTDNENWSTDIPQNTNVGDYNVWYKVVGDVNHENINSTKISNVEIKKANLNVSINNIVKTYDGSSVNISTAINSVKDAANTDVVYNVSFGITEGNYDQTDISLTNVSDSKIFYYEISYDTTNYNVATGSFTATINKASVSEPVSFSSKDFTGETLKPDVSNNKYSVVNGFINAGTYSVELQLTDKENYKWSGTDNSNNVTINDSFTINKVAMTYTTGNVVANFTYDGIEHDLISGFNVTGGDVAFKINNIESSAVATNAGNYEIFYKYIADENHSGSTDYTKLGDVIISQYNVTLKATTSSILYDGKAHTLSNGYDELNSGTVLSNHNIVVKYGTNGAGITITNVSESITELDGTLFSVQIFDNNSVDVTENYNITKLSGSFTIEPKDVIFTSPTSVSVDYNGDFQNLVSVGSCDHGHFEYKINDGEFSTDIPNARDSGTYTIYYKIIADTNYKAPEEIYNFTSSINASNASMTGTITAKIGLVYSGNPQELVELENVSTTNGTLNFRFEGGEWSTDIPKGLNAGRYTFYYKVIGNLGYIDTEETQLVVEIAKKDIELIEPSANDLVYNGEKQYLISSGSCSVGTIEFSVDDTNWSTDIPEGKNAQNYDVWYRVISTDSNYNNKEKAKISNVKIKKADIEIILPGEKDLTYSGASQILIDGISCNGGVVNYSLDNKNWDTSLPSAINANSYTIYYKVINDANYNAHDGGQITSIIKSAEITNVVIDGLNMIYDGAKHNIVVNKNAETINNQELTWLFSENNTDWFSSIEVKNFINQTYYYKISANNHEEKKGSFDVSISKKALSVIAKTEEFKYNGCEQYSVGYSIATGLCEDDNIEVVYDVNSKVKNVSDGIIENIISLVIIRDDGNFDITENYNISTINGSIKVNARTICVEAYSESKEYDGNPLTNSNVKTNAIGYDGLANNHNVETVMSAKSTITYYNENGVENVISKVKIIDENSADVSNNYIITKESGILKILKKSISITNISVKNKEYDGSRVAEIVGGAEFEGLADCDIGQIAIIVSSASFEDKNVGTKRIYFSGPSITGEHAKNYNVTSWPSDVMATITPKTVSIKNTSVKNKVYDGTTNAEVLYAGIIEGVIENDNVNIEIGNANFIDKNIGLNKQVIFTDFALTGSDAGNYILYAQPINAIANITPKELNITGISVEDKVYNGTTDAITTGYLNLEGIVEGEGLLWTINSIRFADKNAGDNKQIIVDITLDGLNKDNYIICEPNLTASIAKKSVSILGITVDNKFYDGTTIATISGTPILSEVISGDDVYVSMGRARFLDAKIGFNKPVMFSNFGIYGTNANNYELIGQPENATANILAIHGSDNDGVVFNEDNLKDGVDITTIFENARTEENEVIIDLGDKGQIIFNSDAVNEIAGNNVVLKINEVSEVTENVEKSGLTPELTLEINMSNVSFEDGKATISYDFEKGVPFGKNLKVYYIDLDGNKTDMSANYKDGRIIFDTNHFSTYVVVYETNVGLIGGLAGGAVVLLAGGIFTICWFTRKKKIK